MTRTGHVRNILEYGLGHEILVHDVFLPSFRIGVS